MTLPELVFVTGPNAAGKSSFIRSRLSGFDGYKTIMTDVYKGKFKEVFTDVIRKKQSVILETPFNDESVKNLIDEAKNAGYNTILIMLFLKDPSQSVERVAYRRLNESGLLITEGNVKYNFTENFKNVAKYFFYFDEALFIDTGAINSNDLVMKFNKSELIYYKANAHQFIQKFAAYSYSQQRMDKTPYDIIVANTNYDKVGNKSTSIASKFNL
jgi:predicted ABC-type ATPase